MSLQRHGISIGIERVSNHFFLSIKAIGKLEHEDYETITPMIDSALEGIKDPIVDVYFDASEFEGWALRAAWDDLRLGLKHGKDFRKIALYGRRKWQKVATRIGSWFIGGEAKFFEDPEAALEWLDQD
jgi:hypothetical protein